MTQHTDTTAERLAEELAPNFELVRLVGEGSVARVYLAREAALERLVAIKVLRPELHGDATVNRRFQREARSAARISHPNVTAIHRVGALSDGLPYMIMEYVDGRNLADTLAAHGAMNRYGARRALAQIAAALAAAHEKRIVHRDVKPSNILVERKTGRVVLTDFGIAGIIDTGSAHATRLTQVGQVLGDPRYLSPEQLRTEPTTDEADVYSMGVVGYEILTLEGPFGHGRPVEIATAHLTKPPRPIRELRSDVDADLASLLERCLSKRPEHRPSAAEVAAALAGQADAEVDRAAPRPGPGVPVPDPEPPAFPALSNFLAELRRRRVYRTAVAYAAAIFVLLEAADLILPETPLPEWTYTILVAVVVAGFPVILVLGWVFDISASGIHRTESMATGDAARYQTGQLALQIIGIAVSVILAGLIGWWILR